MGGMAEVDGKNDDLLTRLVASLSFLLSCSPSALCENGVKRIPSDKLPPSLP